MLQIICTYLIKEPYHTSIFSGEGWIQELLEGHPKCIQCELGVSKNVFYALIEELQDMGYGNSRYITLEEQLAIYLYMCITELTIAHFFIFIFNINNLYPSVLKTVWHTTKVQ